MSILSDLRISQGEWQGHTFNMPTGGDDFMPGATIQVVQARGAVEIAVVLERNDDYEQEANTALMAASPWLFETLLDAKCGRCGTFYRMTTTNSCNECAKPRQHLMQLLATLKDPQRNPLKKV